MKKIIFILAVLTLTFTACDNSSKTTNTGSKPANGSDKPTDSNAPTDTVVSTPIQVGESKCASGNQLANHKYCQQISLNNEDFLKILDFKSDCSLLLSSVKMSDTQISESDTGAWQLQGNYLTVQSMRFGSSIRPVKFDMIGQTPTLVFSNPTETYTICD